MHTDKFKREKMNTISICIARGHNLDRIADFVKIISGWYVQQHSLLLVVRQEGVSEA